ncbi:MAG: hypothetical protein H6999_03805 [Hahellaceae bacterium]|nr:hypothetical protein [Hahellaceae bacterium]MCP5168863.1 hypothetical protein [Hahellaceae bacterium]
MPLHYYLKDVLAGLLIYGTGDTCAALLSGEQSLTRTLGICLIGGLIYAFEIPNYFRWIVSRTQLLSPQKRVWLRTSLAIAYFNPLWISRHLAFITLLNGQAESLSWHIIYVATQSFLFALPVTLCANLIIQNGLALRFRFIGSALFSSGMAIYYPLSAAYL